MRIPHCIRTSAVERSSARQNTAEDVQLVRTQLRTVVTQGVATTLLFSRYIYIQLARHPKESEQFNLIYSQVDELGNTQKKGKGLVTSLSASAAASREPCELLVLGYRCNLSLRAVRMIVCRGFEGVRKVS